MIKKPWIQVSATILINLNYIIKITRQASSTGAEGIMFFHASSGNGSNQFVPYASSGDADTKFAEIVALMNAEAVTTDIT